MTKTYPEPPDTTIVGFGSPITRAYVRIDEWSINMPPDARWWEATDGSVKEPLTWEQITDGRHYGAPYILEPKAMEVSE